MEEETNDVTTEGGEDVMTVGGAVADKFEEEELWWGLHGLQWE